MTQVRLEDGSGRPVAGVQVTCLVDEIIWSKLQSDAEGRCQVTMAPEVGIELTAKPQGARPIWADFGGDREDRTSVTLPVLPPIRGRVLDPAGQPVPGVAVGRWVSFQDDGTKTVGEMNPFLRGESAVTDREGNFAIALTVERRFYVKMAGPEQEALCFSDPDFRRLAYQVIAANRAIEPLTVTLKPARRVRIPFSPVFAVSARETELYSYFSFELRPGIPASSFLILHRTHKQKQGAEQRADKGLIEEYLPEGALPQPFG